MRRTVHNEPSHLNLHFLPFCFGFCADDPILTMDIPKFNEGSPAQKVRFERVKTVLVTWSFPAGLFYF